MVLREAVQLLVRHLVRWLAVHGDLSRVRGIAGVPRRVVPVLSQA